MALRFLLGKKLSVARANGEIYRSPQALIALTKFMEGSCQMDGN